MELERPKFESVETENLEKWKLIGFGGFGQVFKARHKKWRCDVAIKLPRDADGDIELCEEANHMAQVSFHSSVLRLYGIYSGYPPNGGQKIQLGIVMEFMDRGSVQTLLETLSGPPPYPLAFRLAYEIAQGMNFLHEKGILHHDLKPSNVLLDGDLHAKLADFGLSRVSTSVLMNSKEMSTVKGGTPEYMPPESFDPLYEPVRKFDIYSYGILLWSIICGKKPFPDADPGLVKVRIPKGDRPPCKEIDQTKAEGLRELVGLMERCWDGDPSKRPDFGGQSESNDIVDARTEMQNMQLDHQQSNTSSPSGFTAEMPASNDTLDIPLQQNNVSSSARNLTEHEKAAEFVDRNRKTLIQEVSEVLAIAEELGDLVHPEAYSKIRATRTSRDGMRELFDGPLRSGGRRVKAAFFDALKKHHPDLVERLGG
ncbi:ankyrin repeat and protein kinase domain-containing protein 1-like isoform X5 [Neolamprologus brichardi]|uniref:ankyrin repeat and protein kinase domain-containing protein 1-like isoform X5 n=1 Tax=Neolamprologus brichardi TaxID=32507 RepID=UPI0016439C20|nr:ankyrin repeat and protein kinase domain-containing protein 1-like isoform X5 [Neolamprologus brichardi]